MTVSPSLTPRCIITFFHHKRERLGAVALCLNPSRRAMKMRRAKGNNAGTYKEGKGDFCLLNVQPQSGF